MSADDNAPVQAREVEVVARAILDASGFPNSPITPADLSIGMAAHRALAPIREAERQEAAREALLTAAEQVAAWHNREHEMVAIHHHDPAVRDALKNAWTMLRERADGVTGRGDDDTDHEQKDTTPEEHR